MTITRIPVSTAAPYDVVIGTGVLGELTHLVGPTAQRVGIVVPTSLAVTGEEIRADLEGQGYTAVVLEVPDGEDQKTPAVAAFAWSALAQSGFTRTDVLVGVGGGATTDLAGFIAATWLRGVRIVQVPTTLLAMVDAAVGGKTGINVEEGKNLVGVIHEPAGVLCDLSALETLPRNDLVAGLAEVVKCGFIADPMILDIIESDPQACTQWDSPQLRDIIERAITVKAAVVADDLHERIGARLGREVLNYGHTFGHAIEKVESFRWRHGAAVSVGMMYVAELARLAGRLDDAQVDRHRTILTALGLPTTYAGGRWEALLSAMRLDKKTRGDMLRFVILDDLAKASILEGPDPALLIAAYEEVSA
jgi:3-dehydroquinate synthase